MCSSRAITTASSTKLLRQKSLRHRAIETGELQASDNVRLASEIGMRAGGDFIKTSTGKIAPAATIPGTLVMLEAIREHFYETGASVSGSNPPTASTTPSRRWLIL